MSEQLVSTDPNYGMNAPPPAVGAHPEARMSAADHPIGQPYVALPEGSVDAAGMRKVVGPGIERFMSEPLVHPTGIDALDSFLSPASLALMTATSGPAAAKAVTGAVASLAEHAGGAVAKKLLKLVMPSMLKKPAELADLLTEIGNAVKTRNSAAPTTASAPTAPPVAAAPVEPVASGPVVPAPQAAPVDRTAAPPLSVEAPPSGPSPAAQALPDQRALNDAALARRRAEYQARQAAETTTTVPPPPEKFVPTPKEMAEYMRLVKAGKSHAEAGQVIVAQRELAQRLGLSTPTAEETRFPKGMRGGLPK